MAQPNRTVGNNARAFPSQQSLNAAVKSICDIMRRSNCAGALQYVPELTWILFLRILDEREAREAEEAEAVGAEHTPSLESPLLDLIEERGKEVSTAVARLRERLRSS